MESRRLGRTGRHVSVVGLGCWQLGSDWGHLDELDAFAILDAAIGSGVTFLDTADVYGDGRSETLIGKFLAERGNAGITVATKMGRRAQPHVAAAYTLANFRNWIDRSRRNLRVDTVDLIQLHCPPSPVFDDDQVYDALDTVVDEGRAAAYGISVEPWTRRCWQLPARGLPPCKSFSTSSGASHWSRCCQPPRQQGSG
jgi:aryl-alcohol dehydrogenase-like predicted oxidoreductase